MQVDTELAGDPGSPAVADPAALSTPSATAPAAEYVGPPAGHDPQYLPITPIWTPEIERKIALSLEWIVSDMRGALLTGLPLVGKSHFLLYAKQVIPPLLGGSVSMQLWSFLGYEGGAADDLLRHLMLQSGCRAVSARSTSVLRGRLVEHLCGVAEAIGARRIVLLIDELQELPAELYPVVMGIASALQSEGFVPCSISMAQIEMRERVGEFFEQGKLQVIGRFFSQVQPYEALSVDDAIETIKNIEGGHGHFTGRWFPHLHAQGWSLERLGPPLKESIDRLRGEKGLAQQVLLPFNYFRPALKYMLRKLANVPECAAGLSTDDVYECLSRTGYFDVVHYYAQAEATE